jgi:hypothetical protein
VTGSLDKNGLHRTALRARDILAIAALIMLANNTLGPFVTREFVVKPVMAQVSQEIGQEIGRQMKFYSDSLADVFHAEAAVRDKIDSAEFAAIRRDTFTKIEIARMREASFHRQDSLHDDLARLIERKRGWR